MKIQYRFHGRLCQCRRQNSYCLKQGIRLSRIEAHTILSNQCILFTSSISLDIPEIIYKLYRLMDKGTSSGSGIEYSLGNIRILVREKLSAYHSGNTLKQYAVKRVCVLLLIKEHVRLYQFHHSNFFLALREDMNLSFPCKGS